MTPAARMAMADQLASSPALGERGVVEQFELQVARAPDAPALRFGGETLSYAELDCRANQIAHRLIDLGVGPESLIGISVARSFEQIIGVLGILKAGAAYVPLDPQLPEARLAYLLADSAVAHVLVHRPTAARYAEVACSLVDLDEVLATPSWRDHPGRRGTRSSSAYVIYTSGSTGAPKGVVIEHGSLLNHVEVTRQIYQLSARDRVLQFASLSFDVSVEEIFPCLASGGTLVLRAEAMLDSVSTFLAACAAWEITVLSLPTAFWHELVAAPEVLDVAWPPSVRLVILGGEAVQREALARWQRSAAARPGVTLLNVYGPTEVTVGVTWLDLTAEPAERDVSIGRPFPHARVYVLDEAQQPVAAGMPGEIYLGGPGVARGYLRRPELDEQRFLPDPWSPPGARMYRSGDLGRHRSDGNLEFLGRIDQQVKVRGFRIELGEIEAALLRLPGVGQAVVTVRQDVGPARLIAHVVAASSRELSASELIAQLAKLLPEYMVPSAIVELAALPLTPNGKIDVRALPMPIEAELARAAQPPGTDAEVQIAALFAEVLGLSTIGAEDDFFALGGHSLSATRLGSRIREVCGVELGLRALFEARTVAAIARLLELAPSSSTSAGEPLHPTKRTGAEPLSFAQQRLWMLDQLTPDSPAYNLVWTVALRGPLQLPALRRALEQVVARHEILRTRYARRGAAPAQIIDEEIAVELPVTDASSAADARAVIERDAALPFELSAGAPWRLRLVRVSEHEHWLALVIHHIAFDGWSGDVLLRELAALYALYALHATGSAPAPLSVQYADYASWQRSRLDGAALEAQRRYWYDHLRGAPLLLELPTDRPRPEIQTFAGASHTVEISAALTRSLDELAAREGATSFMVLLAAFNVLLSRLSGQRDLLVGVPISGRGRRETEALLGFFVNTLVMRTQLGDRATVRELIAQTRATALGAYANQEVPFEQLVALLRPERDLRTSPIFQVFFSFEEAPPVVRLGELQVEPLEIDTGAARFELGLTISRRASAMVARFEYNTDLFDAATVERLGRYLLTLLAQLPAAPQARVSDLQLLTEEVRHQLVLEWNRTATPFADGRCLHELFEQCAEQTPEAIALRHGPRQWSYRQLEAGANRLAHALARRGCQPGQRIGIALDRSAAMIEAVLAVLKLGAAYVPLDPVYPPERIRYMVEDAQLSLVVTTSVHRAQLGAAVLLCLDDEAGWIATLPATRVAKACGPLDAAYVIYTSGSTGRPKGVVGHHRGVCNLRQTHLDALGVRAGDRVLQFASLSFDASLWEICMALTTGATLMLADRDTLASSDRLQALLETEQVTVATLPPTMLSLLSPAQTALRLVVSAGEACSLELVRRWASGRALVNAYGPTEATVCATLVRCDAADPRPPSIGRPIGNARVYVLEDNGQLAAAGVVGELCIAGIGLAHGYLHRETLTAEKFVPDPFYPGERMYRSGDLARYRGDGEIEFLGRIDHQVKLRGHRIEPGEIEARLCAHPAISAALVMVREDRPGERALVAYVASDAAERIDAPSISELREHLSSLPGYMVPSAYVVLAQLPLTPNGKIDRRALPAPSRDAGAAAEYAPPRTALEAALVRGFCDVLQVERVGIHDNFFHLGGHSLLGTRFTAYVQRELGFELTLRDLFQAPTVAMLSARAEKGATSPWRSRVTARAAGARLPLSQGQREIWMGGRMAEDPSVFHVPMTLQVRGPLDVPALQRSLIALIARHEALRTAFPLVAGQPVQVVLAPPELTLATVSLHTLPKAMREREIARHIAEVATRPFDLARGPLLRVRLLRTGDQEHLLLLCTHHIVVDGWSSTVLINDLCALYAQARSPEAHDEAPALPPQPLQLGDYVLWQETFLQGPELARLTGYWQARLAGERPSTELPADFPRPPLRSYRGAARSRTLPVELVDRLRAVCREEQVTLYMAFLAAFYLVLERETGLSDLTVGGTAANRQDPGMHEVIGLFVNMVALRVDTRTCATFRELLRTTRETVLAAEDHQDLPFGQVVRAVGAKADMSRMPLFQTVLRHEMRDDQVHIAADLTLVLVPQGTNTVKLDLELVALESPDGVELIAQFDVALFAPSRLDALLARFHEVLQRLPAVLDIPLQRAELFS
jgi:amino acid adenylation domain-containing protein